MRVAVCISGYIRNYKPYWDIFVKNVIDANPTFTFDIFISTWSQTNTKNSLAYERRGDTNFSDIDITALYNAFNPVSIMIERSDSDLFKEKEVYRAQDRRINVPATFSQFYKVRNVGVLLQEYAKARNIEYNMVIRHRFDYELKNPIKLEQYDPACIYVENESYDMTWISDKFAICSYQNFITYSKFYDNFQRLIDSSGKIIPEELFPIYFKENNIEIRKTDTLNPATWPPRY